MKLLLFLAVFVASMTLDPNDIVKQTIDMVKVKTIQAIQQNGNLKSRADGMN